jgi:hypothetical protein
MQTQLRQVIYLDSIIGSLKAMVDTQTALFAEDGLEFLSTELNTATLIYDVLQTMGISPDAIRLVLGDAMEEIDPEPGSPIICYCCGNKATHVKENPMGGHRLVCDIH